MTSHSRFTLNEARAAGERIGIDWDASPFDLEQFRKGMDIELEGGSMRHAASGGDPGRPGALGRQRNLRRRPRAGKS
jgi:hypothetical protein